MRRILLAAVVGSLVAVGAPARAAGESYRGGCAFFAINDPTPGGQLSDDGLVHGIVRMVVAPFDGAGLPTSATVWCELRINGNTDGTVLGPTSGTGLVVDAGQVQYTTAPTDVVTLCTHVLIGSTALVDCAPTTTPIVPQPVIDALDQVIGVLDQIVDVLNDAVFSQLDPAICAVLMTLAPSVDGLGHSELVYVDPATGDLFVFGTGPEDLLWDCPPYVT